MKNSILKNSAVAVMAVMAGVWAVTAQAGLSAEEAARLKTDLTPLGGEKAANKDGSIPAWTGGYTTPIPGFKNGGKRGDPFAADKPLYTVTAKNAAQYADKLTEGSKALLAKYPETFRIDVYPTRRTAAAPQWVYDNTFKNATQAKIVDMPSGQTPEGAVGGIPFPIPKTGIEVLWNHLLRWRGEAWHMDFNGYLTTADGKRILTQQGRNDHQMPYYFKDGAAKFNGDYWIVRSLTAGPAIRAGEAIAGRVNLDDDKTQAWVYLTGQRRVRKLPNPCCDTPSPISAGISTFDEVEVFAGRVSRYDWKLVGKKEVLIPYNSNRIFQPTKDSEVLGEHFLNPDHVRWELHRVWVVDAELKPGARHVSPKNRYYFDEDTWNGVLGDRYDAKGQLARVAFTIPIVAPDLPGSFNVTWGVYDLVAGSAFVTVLMNEQAEQYKIQPRYPDNTFTPDALAGEAVR